MKVQYTIAGMQPRFREDTQAATFGSTFRGKLLRLSRALPRSWKKILRMEPPTGLEFVAPPLQPEDFEGLTDPVAERFRWRQMLDQKARLMEVSSSESEQQKAIKQMLGLLLTYQVMEDELIARQLSASQETAL